MDYVITLVLILIAIIDLKTHLIHHRFLFLLSVLYFFNEAFNWKALLVAMPLLFTFALVTRCGGGDVKLGLVLAAFQWPQISQSRYLFGFLAVLLPHLLWAILRRESRIALAPSISLPLAYMSLVS